MARSEDEAAEVDAAYEAERQADPDFSRYHVRSDHRQAPECRLDRNDGARILHAFDVTRPSPPRAAPPSISRPGAAATSTTTSRR
jgi:hypothetical protein